MAIKPVWESVGEIKQGIENLSVDDLLAEREANPDLLVVDLRELQECVDKGTIPGAKNVPRGMLEFWADPSSPYYRDYFREERRTIVFCAGGGRCEEENLTLRVTSWVCWSLSFRGTVQFTWGTVEEMTVG